MGDQTRLLEAKASLSLRNSVVENVVAVHPTLNAVHNATHAAPVERYSTIKLLQSDIRDFGWR